jgi:hypothetical protein
MADGWFAAVELLLVFGGVMVWIAWELRSLKRLSRGDRKRKDKNVRP